MTCMHAKIIALMVISFAIFKASDILWDLILFRLCYIITLHSRRAFYWNWYDSLISGLFFFSFFFFSSVALSYFCNTKTYMNRPIIPAVGYFHAFIKRFVSDTVMLLKISSEFTYLKCYHIFYSLLSRSSKIY